MKTQYIPEPQFIKKLFVAATIDCKHLFNNSRVHPVVKLPSNIKSFRLVRSIKPIGYPFAVGKYTKNNKKYIAKIWEGTKHDLHYFALLHEGNTMMALTAMQKRASSHTPKKLYGIRFPVFVEIIKSDKRLVLISEYVNGTLLADISSKKRRVVFDKTISYIRWLGSFATTQEKKIIGEKHISYYALLFPFLMLVVLLKFPTRGLLFFKAAISFCRVIISLWTDRSYVLIHGDIHEKNIILKGSTIILLDVEQATFTYPEYEIISMLLCSIKDKKIIDHFFAKLEEDKRPDSAIRFAGLMSNRAIHYLTGGLSREKKLLHFSLLDFKSIPIREKRSI